MSEVTPLPVHKDPLPFMTREAVEEAVPHLTLLAVVTIQSQQINFRVFPEDAIKIVDDWTNATRDGRAAVTFVAQGIEGRRHIGRWSFATATIASIRQYSQEEFDEKAAAMAQADKAPQGQRGRG